MAQKVNITLEDDLDGGKATETVAFGLDGNTYEIDLSTKNAKALREALNKYVQASRLTSGRKARKAATTPRKAASTASKGTTRRGGGGARKRTATMEEIEASKG